jgi:hypothetical protein
MKDVRLPAIASAAAALLLALGGSVSAGTGGEGAVPHALLKADGVVDTAPRTTVSAVLIGETASARDNDYPTATRADYVIGCMAANGNTREALLKCSCAIDTIAGLMPYSHYERAETALSLQLGGGVGGRIGLFRDPPQIKAVIEELRRAQAEANLQCR